MGKKSRKKSKNKRNKKSAKKYKGGGGKDDIFKMLKDTSPDELVSRADELLSMAHESSPESPSSLKMTINSIMHRNLSIIINYGENLLSKKCKKII